MGPPARAINTQGASIDRDITRGNPTVLDLADDTNDSAADFDVALLPTPRNLAGATTTRGALVSSGGASATFAAAAGVANAASVETTPTHYAFQDGSAPVIAGPGCQQVWVNRVRCPKPGITRLFLNGGDGADALNTTSAAGIAVTLDGGSGNDRLVAREQADTLLGGTGNDTLDGGAGPDVLDGGADKDTATYTARTAAQPVIVDIDGTADDGGALDDAGGVRDDVQDTIEHLIGGSGADRLTGSARANTIEGGGGADELHGLAENDKLKSKGDGAVDTVTCGAGLRDEIVADLTDVFPTTGPDACERIS